MAGYCTKQESNHSSRLCSKLIPMKKIFVLYYSFASVILLMVSISSSQALKGSSDSLSYQSPYKLALTEPQADLLKPNSAPPRDNWRHESALLTNGGIRTGPCEYTKRGVLRRGAIPLIAHITELRLSGNGKESWLWHSNLSDFHTSITIFRIGIRPKNRSGKKYFSVETQKAWTCSDFSSWLYNYGLGLKLPTGIKKQANADFVQTSDQSYSTKIETIANDGSFDSMV